jgi:DUF2911 family protein
MKQALSVLVLVWCAAVFLHGQNRLPPGTIVEAEPALGERGLTRIHWWSPQRDVPVAAVSIDFGRPVWNRQLDNPSVFDQLTRGRVWRLGNDYWTTLDTNLPLNIAGHDVPVGLWYLGLSRSTDGTVWSLAFIDPVKARSGHMDGHWMDAVPIEFKAPLKVETTTAPLTEKLTITLSDQPGNMTNLSLLIAWGRLHLTTPIRAVLG